MSRIGLVVSDFNYDITSLMQKKAEEQSELLGFEHEAIRVPGVFDMPLAVKLLLKSETTKPILGILILTQNLSCTIISLPETLPRH